MLTGTWWIAALGAAGWLLVAAVGGSPPEPPGVPQLAGAYAATAARLEALRSRITEAVGGAAPLVRGCMEDIPGQVALLVAQCRSHLLKQAQLDRFLAESEADDPAGDAQRMATAAAGAVDPAARERWLQAEAAARSRLDELARIRTNRERTAADLAEVEARLKQVLSQVVSMDSVDQGRITGMSSELHATLGELSQQVTVMGRVLRPEAEAATDDEPIHPPTRQAQ